MPLAKRPAAIRAYVAGKRRSESGPVRWFPCCDQVVTRPAHVKGADVLLPEGSQGPVRAATRRWLVVTTPSPTRRVLVTLSQYLVRTIYVLQHGTRALRWMGVFAGPSGSIRPESQWRVVTCSAHIERGVGCDVSPKSSPMIGQRRSRPPPRSRRTHPHPQRAGWTETHRENTPIRRHFTYPRCLVLAAAMKAASGAFLAKGAIFEVVG
jgi:hypothetical protein